LIVSDDLTENGSQFREVAIQIDCVSPNDIPVILEAYIDEYAFAISIEIIREMVDDSKRKLATTYVTKNSEGSLSYDSSWDLSGEDEVQEGQT
jgi:hypothetical protein